MAFRLLPAGDARLEHRFLSHLGERLDKQLDNGLSTSPTFRRLVRFLVDTRWALWGLLLQLAVVVIV